MVMMNIAKSAVSSVRALLKKKGLKDAVDVTTKKAKGVSAKAKEAVAKAKPKVDKAAQAVKAKAKPVTDKVKPAVEKAKAKVKPAVEKAKKGAKAVGRAAGTTAATIGTVGAAVGAPLGAAANVGAGKVVRATKDKVAKMRGIPRKRSRENKALNELSDGVTGAVAGAAIGGIGALAATGALAASLIKTNQPKESGYTVKRLSDGRFSTTFQDANANAVFSSKQLSPKDIADVRKNVAVLDSIVLGDNISFLEKQEFMARLNYLSDKYGVNNITGKNLSVLIPAVGKA